MCSQLRPKPSSLNALRPLREDCPTCRQHMMCVPRAIRVSRPRAVATAHSEDYDCEKSRRFAANFHKNYIKNTVLLQCILVQQECQCFPQRALSQPKLAPASHNWRPAANDDVVAPSTRGRPRTTRGRTTTTTNRPKGRRGRVGQRRRRGALERRRDDQKTKRAHTTALSAAFRSCSSTCKACRSTMRTGATTCCISRAERQDYFQL
jgi:hypothetical protein